MKKVRQGASDSITDKKLAGCFVTSFCSANGSEQRKQTTPDSSQVSSPNSSKGQNSHSDTDTESIFVGQTGLPTCKMLIMGDFTESSQRKESYLSTLQWQKLPYDRAPKFYSEKNADHQLIMHDISSCDNNSFTVSLRTSTYIVIAPSSAQDLSLCCHAVFNQKQLLAEDCSVVYLNLAEQKSKDYNAIEDEAKKWIGKGFKFSSVEAASVSMLIEKAVNHAKTVCQRLSDSSSKEFKGSHGASQTANGYVPGMY